MPKNQKNRIMKDVCPQDTTKNVIRAEVYIELNYEKTSY